MTLLGAIADDLTGATDLANTLVKAGMRTALLVGSPGDETVPEVDALVIALKTRSIAADAAVGLSLNALQELRALGASQFFFKYCSTFDSTNQGNIGPVATALLEALGSDFTIFCPAFPDNGRSVYQGHLFVGDRLLSESGMENHPLNPMRDPNLVRVLRRQSPAPVALISIATVRAGAEAIRSSIREVRAQGIPFAIVDAIENDDLIAIGRAAADLPLVTGGSGLAIGLPHNFVRAGLLKPNESKCERLPSIPGPTAILSGSCSKATNEQVALFRKTNSVFDLDPRRLAMNEDLVGTALQWAEAQLGREPILISATTTPEKVLAGAGECVEQALARISKRLLERGVRRLIVAGGETSGAVIQALGVRILRVGREIAPGVPWTVSTGPEPLALALKSGNFGGPNFFMDAFQSEQ